VGIDEAFANSPVGISGEIYSMEECIANEKAAFALSNGVAGEKVGRGYKVTVDSITSNQY
jgi:hypothetical protein